MGGRGKSKGGGKQLWMGGTIIGQGGDMAFAIPIDQYVGTGPRFMPAGQAASVVKSALGASKSGVKVSTKDAMNIANTLIAAGGMMGKGSLRTRLYRAARLLGDVKAISGGPTTITRRIMRRMAGKITGQTFRQLFK